MSSTTEVVTSTGVDERVSGLLEIATAINSTLNFKGLLKVLAQKTAQVCSVDRCSIFLWRDDRLVPAMSQFASGLHRPDLWSAFTALGSYAVDDIPAFARALATRQPVLVTDPAGSGLLPRSWVDLFDLRSVLVFPLLRQDEFIGTMHLDNCLSARRIPDDRVMLAQAISSQLALAIDNARLAEETRSRLHETETLLRVGRTIGSSLDLQEVARRITREGARTVDADSASIYVRRGATCLQPLAGYHIPKPVLEVLQNEPLFIDEFEPLTRFVTRSEPSLWSEDVPGDPRFEHQIFHRFPMQSILVTRLHAKDEIVGALACVWWTRRHRFSRAELRVIGGLADQAALAIVNARLYAAAEEAAVSRERVRLARELHDALSQSVFSLGLKLDWCRHHARARSHLRRKIGEIKDDTRVIMSQMRTLIYELSSDQGVDEPFHPRLAKLVEEFRELSGVTVAFVAQGDATRLARPQQEALLKTFQEALANIVKHARATRATVLLEIFDSEARFELSDDGVGLPADLSPARLAEEPGHLGLRQIIERIEEVDGEVEFGQAFPSGFAVRGLLRLS